MLEMKIKESMASSRIYGRDHTELMHIGGHNAFLLKEMDGEDCSRTSKW